MVASRSVRKKRKKPSKPYPSFALTAHNNGQWCKKIRGKIHFFGRWDDPQAALDNYLHVAADLHAGRLPQQLTLSSESMTVKDVCNHFLTYQSKKAEAGDISVRWFEDCRRVLDSFARFLGTRRLVSNLRPEDFLKFRQRLAKGGLTGKRRIGVHALNRAVTVIRGMFKYAYELDLIDKPIKYGKAFDRPSATLKRKARRLAENENGKRLFEPAEIQDMLKIASDPLKAMIFLGINGGFGNTDCARLLTKAIDFNQRLIEFDRPKTGIERIVPLWSETADALHAVLANKPKSTDKNLADLVFLTTFGQPWVRDTIHRSADEAIEKIVPLDSIGQEFNKLLRQLGIKRKGIGFYALRHTFRTWADEARDQHAIHRIMGHAIPGMSGIYIEKIGLNRLRAVTDHVRARLFGEGPQQTYHHLQSIRYLANPRGGG